MVTIAALVCDRASRARLRSAMRGQADVAFCDTVPELVSAVADGAATAVVTEWRDVSGSRLDAAVRTLHAEYPTVPILVYAPLTPQGARDMLDAARAGASEIVIANFDDVGITLSQRLTTAQATALGRQVMARVTELVPTTVAALIDYFSATVDRLQRSQRRRGHCRCAERRWRCIARAGSVQGPVLWRAGHG